jgi:hypothetical protein
MLKVVTATCGRALGAQRVAGKSAQVLETQPRPIVFRSPIPKPASSMVEPGFVTRQPIESFSLLARLYRAPLVTGARFGRGAHTDETELLARHIPH